MLPQLLPVAFVWSPVLTGIARPSSARMRVPEGRGGASTGQPLSMRRWSSFPEVDARWEEPARATTWTRNAFQVHQGVFLQVPQAAAREGPAFSLESFLNKLKLKHRASQSRLHSSVLKSLAAISLPSLYLCVFIRLLDGYVDSKLEMGLERSYSICFGSHQPTPFGYLTMV